MNAAVEQQSALYKDYAVFQQVFPEVQQALKVAMGKLVKARPADPIAFLAIKLREAGEEIKIEKVEEERERKEQEAAALRIQSFGRAKKDKARVEQIKVNNGIFVRELFRKLATNNVVNGTALLLFTNGGADRDSLDLPARLGKHIPPKVNATCRGIVSTINTWPTTDKDLEYLEFAAMFGLSESAALEAEQAAAAVRIQAMSRKRRGAAVAIDRKRKTLESVDAGAYTKAL